MKKSVERQIQQIYGEVFKKVFTPKRLRTMRHGSKGTLRKTITTIAKSKEYDEFAKKFSLALSKKGLSGSKGVWRKYYEAAKKSRYVALPKTIKAYEASIMKTAIEHNFNMIKTIPDRILELVGRKYMSTLISEVGKGEITRGSFRRQLASHGHKNAKLIARTETAKLQTAILETRSIELGSVAYIWRSSHDSRTRKSHKDMNDVVVFWQKETLKPLLDKMYGNAGEFPNCRCSPQPIVNTDSLTKHNYNVYDYKTHKVIRMSKAKLIEALNKGSL